MEKHLISTVDSHSIKKDPVYVTVADNYSE
jgi:hypothetical protein